MTKRLFKVTILFCLIISLFTILSFADDENYLTYLTYNENWGTIPGHLAYFGSTPSYPNIFVGSQNSTYNGNTYIFKTGSRIYFVVPENLDSFFTIVNTNNTTYNPLDASNYSSLAYNSEYDLYYVYTIVNGITSAYSYNSLTDGLSAIRSDLNTPSFTKNANVDEFLANTIISMGIRYSQYSDALNVASAAWDYIIDENNWYIGSGDRNDKDIIWNIDTAVSYANAQSNNYLDWYNGYKVNKDLTVALTKFISDNFTASSLGQGTLAGYNVYYDSSYSYSAGGYGFGGSPSAYSFYPASTITYFNGAYLHEDNVIDQDEFVYSPSDVRKFLGYPSSSGLIEPPDSFSGTGVITDGNGDTVYNIDLDWPSFDWLADAIQSVLDFLDRLITTIADFLTQILDAILSLFSDAFESLTEFGEGIIEWIYAIVAGFSTIGGNYIPSSLWAVILPFILINIGVGLIMFVMRSH